MVDFAPTRQAGRNVPQNLYNVRTQSMDHTDVISFNDTLNLQNRTCKFSVLNDSSEQASTKHIKSMRLNYDSKEVQYDMHLLSGNPPLSNSFGNTLSTQNLALTLKEKEIEERISRKQRISKN